MIEVPEILTHDFFEQLVGKPLRIETGGKALDLTLEEVELLPPPRERRRGKLQQITRPLKRAQPFSLLFAGPRDQVLEQQIYEMSNEELNRPLKIFIVALSQDPDATIYEAIFA